jgi:cell division protein FtsB
MMIAAGLLIGATSCEEHKRLSSQIAETNAELRRVQSEASDLQDEINTLTQSNQSLRSHSAVRKGAGAFEQQVSLYEREVATLTERKNALEAEIASLRKDLENYRAKNQR